MRTCSGCGHGLAADARFCGVCGAPHAPAPAVAPASVPHAHAPTPAPYAAPPGAEPPRKGRALAAVIVVAGLGAALAIQLLARPGSTSGPAPGAAAPALAPPQHELAVSRSTPAVATATTTTTTTTTTNNPGLPDPPTAPAPTAAAADAGARATATALCENQKHGFAFAYPADWFTASADPASACSLFDRQPFQVAANAAPPLVAVRVELVPETLAVVEPLLTDNPALLVRKRTRASAAGHPAIVLEAEGTGQGDPTRGEAGYLWLIDHGQNTLIVMGEVDPGGDLAARKAEVDLLVAGLRLAATSGP